MTVEHKRGEVLNQQSQVPAVELVIEFEDGEQKRYAIPAGDKHMFYWANTERVRVTRIRLMRAPK